MFFRLVPSLSCPSAVDDSRMRYAPDALPSEGKSHTSNRVGCANKFISLHGLRPTRKIKTHHRLTKKIRALAYDRRSSAYEIETSQVKDLYGFTYHRLKPERSGLSPVQVAAQHVRLFDLGRPADTIFAVQRCTICGRECAN